MIVQDQSQADIARELGVSQPRISQIVSKAKKDGTLQAAIDAHRATQVQPVEPEEVEITPRPAVGFANPQVQVTPQGGSEWRGVGLAQTLAERHRQILIVQGEQAAKEFALRECWTSVRQGTPLEALSQMFDLPVSELQALINEARERALARIDRFDARLSLSSAMGDLEIARGAAQRTLMSPKSSEAARALARDALIRLAGREVELAVAVEQFRHAHGLTADADDRPGMDTLSYWIEAPKKGAAR